MGNGVPPQSIGRWIHLRPHRFLVMRSGRWERDNYPLGDSWNTHSPGQQSCWIVWYVPQVEVRYLLLANAASIWNSQREPATIQIFGVEHTIPMQAAVYRKGNIAPGSINASVLVHIVYP